MWRNRGGGAALIAFLLAFHPALADNAAAQKPLPEDPESGLVVAPGWELVRANCSACHSTRLVVQNHKTQAGWVHTIRWMQEKHGLWNLGASEKTIVSYLASHYGTQTQAADFRRRPLNQPPLESTENAP